MSATGSAVGEPGLGASGRGLADVTRLAASPAAVWQGILATNADYIAEAAAALRAALPATIPELEDGARVSELFAQANRWLDVLHASTGARDGSA
jgi:hypothetical protein